MRKNLLIIIFLLLFPAIAQPLSLSQPLAHLKTGDGHLVLFSAQHQEILKINYRGKEGHYKPKALEKISQLMRSPDGEKGPMAIGLIEWIDALQDYFGIDTVEIISGFRSEKYNRALKENGRDVALKSLHIQGQAADIHMDEVNEKALYELARDMQVGGTGFYPDLQFVHLDLGPARHWEEKPGPRKLIGTQANTGPCQITTEQNFYPVIASKIFVTIVGPPPCSGNPEIIFEHFHRNRWEALPRESHLIPMAAPSNRAPVYVIPFMAERPAGKYRLKATIPGSKIPDSLSNEFYLKKE